MESVHPAPKGFGAELLRTRSSKRRWNNTWMVSRYVEPTTLHADSFSCPRCHALASQEWSALYRYSPDERLFPVADSPRNIFDPRARGSDGVVRQGHVTWSVSKCFSCKDFSLWIDNELAWPPLKDRVAGELPEPSVDLPPAVQDLYKEAAAVLPHSKRAAAALCRAALEQMVKYLTQDLPMESRLDDRLASLSERVSPSTFKALHIIRHTGNTALHGEKDGDQSAVIYLDGSDGTIAEVFFVAINALAEELITKPREMEDLYSKLPNGVRESLEAKARKS